MQTAVTLADDRISSISSPHIKSARSGNPQMLRVAGRKYADNAVSGPAHVPISILDCSAKLWSQHHRQTCCPSHAINERKCPAFLACIYNWALLYVVLVSESSIYDFECVENDPASFPQAQKRAPKLYYEYRTSLQQDNGFSYRHSRGCSGRTGRWDWAFAWKSRRCIAEGWQTALLQLDYWYV